MTTASDIRPADAVGQQALAVEINGLNPIDESERHGHPRILFWPWFAANVSVLGVSYGSFLLGFGISFWQATLVAIVGIFVSFLFCGFISLAGKRGSAPTLTLSRPSSPGCSRWAGRPCSPHSRCSPPPPCSPNSGWTAARQPR